MNDDSKTHTSLMTTREAAAYCKVSVTTINTAYRESTLLSCGRRGTKGVRMYTAAELDRWCSGAEVE